MEQWFAEIVLAIVLACGFPLIWKTNILLRDMLLANQGMHELLKEAIKSLRHNEIEHVEIVNALRELKTEVIHEIQSSKHR